MTKTGVNKEKYISLDVQDCHYETSYASTNIAIGNSIRTIHHDKTLHFFVMESTTSACIKMDVIRGCNSFQYDSFASDITCFLSENCKGKFFYLTESRNSEKELFIPQPLPYFYNYREISIDYFTLPTEKQYLPLPDRSNFKYVSIVKLQQKLHEIVELVQTYKFVGPIKDGDGGSGIVICGHDGIIKELLILLSHLRKYTTLPIQVFHANDLNEENTKKISELSAVINLSSSALFNERSHQGQDDSRNYHLKPLAMLTTTFSKIIYLDSDAFPLFGEYQLSKIFQLVDTVDMYLFRDYWMMPPDNPIMKILKTEIQRQTDSSVVIFNKEKCKNVLLMAYYMTKDPYFDAIMFGDKDSFWIANAILQPYKLGSNIYVNSDMVGLVDYDNCGYGMAHTISGIPAFLHLNGFKERIRRMIEIPQNMKIKVMASNEGTFKDDYSQTFEITWNEGNCVKSFSKNPIIELKVDLSNILGYFK